MAGGRSIGGVFRAAGAAIGRRDWVAALGALAAADARLARQWLRLRAAHGPVTARAAGEARRRAASAAVGAAEVALQRARAHAAAIETYAPDAWDDHRRACPVPPPPAPVRASIAIVVDARGALAAHLRALLLSLIDQHEVDWIARVIADEETTAHPVASLAAIDSRIGFDRAVPARPTLLVDAGTVLDPQALGWLGYALARTGAAAAIADDDRLVDDPRFGRSHCFPSLRGAFDPQATADDPPLMLLLADGRDAADRVAALGGREARRRMLAAASGGRVAHVPHPLASRLLPTIATRRAPAGTPRVTTQPPPPPAAPAASAAPLRIVMPTRDEPALVDDAVTSLLDLADDPSAIRLVVVDNRSARADTAALLDRLRRERGIEVLAHPEPFNWSRINNLAARDGDERNLLFVNNDTRMLTRGWDRLLAGALAGDGTGAAGARLLYPNGAVQHAGIVLGVGSSPVHDGAGAWVDDPGPLGRWLARRAVAAVTGAFLAVPRTVFEEVGGFDEARLAVGYNDVDLCLAIRETGRRVLFVPDIELVHLESRTRGHNVGKPRVAWDESELASLRARWGASLDVDPGYNPRWTRCERAFSGFRVPTTAETLAWIDRAATIDPWRIARISSG